MTTPNQYAVIDDKVYSTDSVKSKNPVRSYNAKSTFTDKNSGQKYKVLNTVDTNDKYNSQGYEKNGFQGMVVAPVGPNPNDKPDYNHVIMAFAGTNATDWHLNDLSADLSNVVLGFEKDGTLDSQFTSALQYYDEMSKIYNIESVTGHSLGGALAQKVAAANHIPAVTFSTAGVGKQLTEEEKAWLNGEGKEFILNFMHKGDQIPSWTSASDYGTAIYAGDFGNGSLFSGHFLESYQFGKDGSLKDTKGGIWTITDKGTLSNGIELVQKSFKAQLKVLSDLKVRLSASGGGLSSGEKLYLDSAQALAVVSTAGTEFNLAMVNLMQKYQDGIKEAEKLWQDTLSEARRMGTELESWEIYDALESTGCTEYNIVGVPTQQYQMKIDKVREMSDKFKSLESEIKAKIAEIVARDSELAQQLRG